MGVEDDQEEWEEATNNGRDKRPHMKAKSFRAYRKFMAKANTTDRGKHIFHIKNFGMHKQSPLDTVSEKIYRGLVEARKFDEFCRLVPTPTVTKEEEVESFASSILPDDDDIEAQRRLAKLRLVTPSWRIGLKRRLHHPVGMTKHQNNVSNSEGNEQFYSYDGDWQDGKMHGMGIFQFADGHRYEGGFVHGQMDGHATVTHPNGATYQGYFSQSYMHGEGTLVYKNGSRYDGLWKTGRRHGVGRLQYSSGLVYEGDFYVGRFHGRGKIYSPMTGYTFEGTFEEGAIRGYGVLMDPDGKKEVRYWSGLQANRTFTAAIEQMHKERLAKFRTQLEDDDELFSYVRALRLQEYIKGLKIQIATDRYEKRREKLLERRRKMQEMKMAITRKSLVELQQTQNGEEDQARDVPSTAGYDARGGGTDAERVDSHRSSAIVGVGKRASSEVVRSDVGADEHGAVSRRRSVDVVKRVGSGSDRGGGSKPSTADT